MKKKILTYIYIFSYAALLAMIIGGLILMIISFVQHRDMIFNPDTYTKRFVTLDSVIYSTMKGTPRYPRQAYSNQVNKGKTIIEIVNIEKGTFYNYVQKENDKNYIYIWYKPNEEYAYLAKKEETIFPVKEYLRDDRNLIIAFLATIILNRGLHLYLFKRWWSLPRK